MDVLGMPSGAFSYRDSLIGKVRLMPGGVGRNVADRSPAMAIPLS